MLTDPRELALCLLHLDDEDEVQQALEDVGYWNDPYCWRPLGDNSNNTGSIHAQQGDPFSALAEKLTNSIDEVLLQACVLSGIDPESHDAPASLPEAMASFNILGDNASSLGEWLESGVSESDLLRASRSTCITLTGPRERDSIPSISIADQGGGQTPDAVPHTFMSLHRGNKIKTQFLQGKFNMGGTGALRFCSRKNHFQLVITRRNPLLLPSNATDRDHEWSFTIVRKRQARVGERASVYEYLAPVPGDGARGVLSFASASMPIFPRADDREPYVREVEFGTVVKLYQYEWDTKLASRSIAFRGKSVLTQLNCSMPGLALPVRLCDCRGFEGHSVGFTALGLRGWYEHQLDRSKLEPECPITGTILAGGFHFKVRAYVFSFEEERSRDFKANYGVIYTINGQRHAQRDERFFATKAVELPRLTKKLVVVVECDGLSVSGVEEMFMSSRDRLAESQLTHEVESELAKWLHDNDLLRRVHARHVDAEISRRLGDDLPLKDVFKQLLRNNPTLASIFKTGGALPAQTGGTTVGGGSATFVGLMSPTYFRFPVHGSSYSRSASKGQRVLVDFETDAENSYFSRVDNPGRFEATFEGGRTGTPTGSLGTLHDGAVRLDLQLPGDVTVGEVLKIRFSVTDESLVGSLESRLEIVVKAPLLAPAGGGSGRRTRPNAGSGTSGSGGIDLPAIELVQRDHWPDSWDDQTCLEAVIDNGCPVKYRVNADNTHLHQAIRRNPSESELLKRKFELGAALLATSVIFNEEAGHDRLGDAADQLTLEDQVAYVTSVVAQMIIPMVDALGTLSMDDVQDV